MQKFVFSIAMALAVIGASAQSNVKAVTKKEVAERKIAKDTVRIANDSLEYEVMIIDPGFNTWLASRAKPRNYYGLKMMETRNYWFISEYNRRVLDPYRYRPDLYEMRIDYDPKISYGYEVNYLLYNYFLYFQQAYRQKL